MAQQLRALGQLDDHGPLVANPFQTQVKGRIAGEAQRWGAGMASIQPARRHATPAQWDPPPGTIRRRIHRGFTLISRYRWQYGLVDQDNAPHLIP
jgi:hypothetical protein